MIRSYTVRLRPTSTQEGLLWQHVGAVRFVWNWGLATRMEQFEAGEKFMSLNEMKKTLVQKKKDPEFSWLGDVSSQTLATALIDLDIAYKRFFKIQKNGEKFTEKMRLKAKRQGKKLTPYDMKGHPKFKSRQFSKPSFYVRADNLYFKDGTVNIEKIGKIKFKTEQEFAQGRLSVKFINPRVKNVNGKWLLTFGLEQPDKEYELNDCTVGVDLGIKVLAVVSCGDTTFKIKNINKEKSMKRLKKQLNHSLREASRRKKKSKNQGKSYARVKRLHGRIANIRQDYTHKATARIVSMLPKRLVLEDLNVSGMMKNRHLAKAVAEQKFYEFRRQMEYKCEDRGIELVIADRFFPSSKKCSKCGSIKKDLRLRDRVYRCSECGLEIDRDLNAARNLENYAT